MLKSMFKWSRNFKSGKDGLRDRLSLYGDKVVVLRNNKEVEKFLSSNGYFSC